MRIIQHKVAYRLALEVITQSILLALVSFLALITSIKTKSQKDAFLAVLLTLFWLTSMQLIRPLQNVFKFALEYYSLIQLRWVVYQLFVLLYLISTLGITHVFLYVLMELILTQLFVLALTPAMVHTWLTIQLNVVSLVVLMTLTYLPIGTATLVFPFVLLQNMLTLQPEPVRQIAIKVWIYLPTNLSVNAY